MEDHELIAARRIVVYGCTGSGKTTAAEKIGQLTGLPVIDGDALCWRPGWEGVPRDEQITAFSEIASQPEWVIDDDGVDGMLFAQADLIVLLDYPRWLSFQRLLRRSVHRAVTRTPVCNGNYESWRRMIGRDSQLGWHVRTWRPKRQLIRELAAEHPDRTRLFSRPSQLTTWLKSSMVSA